jgi:anti-sigma regulatory factor (Ser/Thr protein kinase)
MFSWAVAIGASFSQQYLARRNHLQEINDQLKWAIARINLVNWYNRGVASRLLHGPIQNVLHATVIRLRESDPRAIVDEALAQLREKLSRLTSTNDANNTDASEACADLEDITALWDEIANVSVTIEPATRTVLQGDKALAVIVRDMCHELVSNAIRHAEATTINVRLDTEPTVVRIGIIDNGKTSAQIRENGLGTTFIEQCSVRWDRFTGFHENHTTITLPRERFNDSVTVQ